jgi:hypothetical protein
MGPLANVEYELNLTRLDKKTESFYLNLLGTKGVILIPMSKDKKPFYGKSKDSIKNLALKYKTEKEYTEMYLKDPLFKTIEDVQFWLDADFFIALLIETSNLYVLDLDEEDSSKRMMELIEQDPTFCQAVEKTPRGLHLYFLKGKDFIASRVIKTSCLGNVFFDYLGKKLVILPDNKERKFLGDEISILPMELKYQLLFCPIKKVDTDPAYFFEGERHNMCVAQLRNFAESKHRFSLELDPKGLKSAEFLNLWEKFSFDPEVGYPDLRKDVEYWLSTLSGKGFLDKTITFPQSESKSESNQKSRVSVPVFAGGDEIWEEKFDSLEGEFDSLEISSSESNEVFRFNGKKLRINFYLKEPQVRGLKKEMHSDFLKQFKLTFQATKVYQKWNPNEWVFGFQNFQEDDDRKKTVDNDASLLSELDNTIAFEEPLEKTKAVLTCILFFSKRKTFRKKFLSIPFVLNEIPFSLKGYFHPVADESRIFAGIRARNCFSTNIPFFASDSKSLAGRDEKQNIMIQLKEITENYTPDKAI